MFILATSILIVASLAVLAAQLWLILLAAHHRRYPWMLAMIFLPFVSLAYGVFFWPEAKRPFLILAVGGPASTILALLLLAGGMNEHLVPEANLSANTPAEQSALRETQPNESPAPFSATTAEARSPVLAETPTAEREQTPVARPPETPIATGLPSPTTPLVQPLALRPVPLQRPNATVGVGFAGFLNDRHDVIRQVWLTVTNSTAYDLRKLRLTLYYRDAAGKPLKEWTSTYEDPGGKPIAGPQTTNEFKIIAFFIPETTRHVIVHVREATFGDGTIWRP